MKIKTPHVIVVMVACLTICWLILPYLKPKPVCKLPLTAPAFGGKVTLASVRRLGKTKVEVKAEAASASSTTLSLGQAYIVYNYRMYEYGVRILTYYPARPSSSEYSFSDVPADATSVDVLQEVYIDRPKKHPHIRFRHLQPGDKPVTKKVINANVKITSIVINGIVEPYGPGTGPYSNGPDIGVSVRSDSTLTYLDINNLSITNDKGLSFDRTDIFEPISLRSGEMEVLPPAPPPTLYERLISIIDSNRAYKSRMKRTDDSTSVVNFRHQGFCYIFKPIYPTPKYLDVEVTGSFPPDKKDVKLVVFHNVPITH